MKLTDERIHEEIEKSLYCHSVSNWPGDEYKDGFKAALKAFNVEELLEVVEVAKVVINSSEEYRYIYCTGEIGRAELKLKKCLENLEEKHVD